MFGCRRGTERRAISPFCLQGALLGLVKFQSGSSKGLQTHSIWANRTPSPSGHVMQWEGSRHPPQSTASCDGLGYGSCKIQLKSVADFLEEASPIWPVENKLNLVSGQVSGSDLPLAGGKGWINFALGLKYFGHYCPLWAVWMWGQHTQLSPLPREVQPAWFPPGFPADQYRAAGAWWHCALTTESTYALLKLASFSLSFLSVLVIVSPVAATAVLCPEVVQCCMSTGV